jgi:TetR/AcrR family transcriptional regulator, regulator of cefoperazone and chloramphenicol sensitivity
MKPLRQDTARTRKSLLTAAGEIFAEKGFRDATIAEISERAGTNIAAVNYHFGNKETLYKEAWLQAFRDSINAHPPDGGVGTDAPPEQRLKSQVTSLLRRITDENNREFVIVTKELANPTGLLEEVMREEMTPLRRRIMGLVREILGAGTPEIEVRFCTVGIISQCVIPMHINMVDRVFTESDSDSLKIDDIEGYAEHVVAFSLAGMAAKGRGIKASANRRPLRPLQVGTKV